MKPFIPVSPSVVVGTFSLLLLIVWAFPQPVRGQGVDAKGKDFSIAFLPTNGDGEFPSFYLMISSERPTSGTLTYMNTGKTKNISIPTAHRPVVIRLDSVDLLMPVPNGPTQEITRRTLRVRFSEEVTLHGMNTMRWSSDGFLALPDDALGREHLVMSYPNTIEPLPIGQLSSRSDFTSQFAVAATQNNTIVTVNPTVRVNVRANSEPFTITLNEGEVFLGQAKDSIRPRAGNDLTGTLITASKPVVVYGGHQRANIPWDETVGRDHLVEQLPAVEFWDSAAVAFPHFQLPKSVPDTNYVRILAAFDNTDIIIHGGYQTTLRAGEAYHIPLLEGMSITASRPVLVAQFQHSTVDAAQLSMPNDTIGDPFMTLVQGTGQYQREYVVECLETDEPAYQGFTHHFVNITIPSDALETLYIDGRRLSEEEFLAFGRVSASDYVCGAIPVPAGSHTFTADEPFGLTVYGYGVYNSYGFPGGMKFLDPPAGVDEEEKRSQRLGAVIGPQPVLSDRATLRLELAEPVRITALLFDGEGKEIRRLLSDYRGRSGSDEIPLDLSGIGSGFYHCRIEDSFGGVRTLPVLILR